MPDRSGVAPKYLVAQGHQAGDSAMFRIKDEPAAKGLTGMAREAARDLYRRKYIKS
jgi:hypothetical protein